MTCIAYKDGVIAYDSRCTDENGVIVSDKYEKRHKIGENYYFLAGYVADLEPFHSWLISGRFTPTREHNSDIFVVSGGELSWGEIKGDDCIIDPPDNKTPWAIGSGANWAIAAMDFGCSAVDAVRYAKTRDNCTGGNVKTFDVAASCKSGG